MNKKIYSMHQEGQPEQPERLERKHTKQDLQLQENVAVCAHGDVPTDCLDFLCDCGEPVSPLSFIGFYRDGIRLRAYCPVCGQKYDFQLKVNFPPVPAQLDNLDKSGYKIISRLRLKKI